MTHQCLFSAPFNFMSEIQEDYTPGDRADPGSDRGVVPLTTPQSTAR